MIFTNSRKDKALKKRKERNFSRYNKPIAIKPLVLKKYNRLLLQEIEKINKLLRSYIYPNLKELILKEDYDSEKVSSFEDRFLAVRSGYYGRDMSTSSDISKRKKSEELQKKIFIIFTHASLHHKNKFATIFETLTGTKPVEDEDKIRMVLNDSLRENVKLIQGLADSYISEVEDIVFTSLKKGIKNKDVAIQVKTLLDSAKLKKKKNAELIANDQLQKLNSDMDRYRQQKAGVNRYIWRTRENARVRDDHSHLNGAIFERGKPPITVTSGKRAGERNEPGKDINCKCRAEMVIEDVLGIKTKKIIEAEKKTKLLKEQGLL